LKEHVKKSNAEQIEPDFGWFKIIINCAKKHHNYRRLVGRIPKYAMFLLSTLHSVCTLKYLSGCYCRVFKTININIAVILISSSTVLIYVMRYLRNWVGRMGTLCNISLLWVENSCTIHLYIYQFIHYSPSCPNIISICKNGNILNMLYGVNVPG
jgi:hypothetical protein